VCSSLVEKPVELLRFILGARQRSRSRSAAKGECKESGKLSFGVRLEHERHVLAGIAATREIEHNLPPTSSAPTLAAVDARLLEQLFDQTADIAFFIKDRAGRYVVVNHSLVRTRWLPHQESQLSANAVQICPGELAAFDR